MTPITCEFSDNLSPKALVSSGTPERESDRRPAWALAALSGEVGVTLEMLVAGRE